MKKHFLTKKYFKLFSKMSFIIKIFNFSKNNKYTNNYCNINTQS